MIKIEGSQSYNFRVKRPDIVVYNAHHSPLLLVECKASHHPVAESGLQQALTYNSKLKAPYLALTNGMQHNYGKIDGAALNLIDSLPDFIEMSGLK